MFGGIRSKFQRFEGEGQISNVLKGKTKIPMFRRIKSKFERSEGQGENCNVWKK